MVFRHSLFCVCDANMEPEELDNRTKQRKEKCAGATSAQQKHNAVDQKKEDGGGVIVVDGHNTHSTQEKYEQADQKRQRKHGQ